MKHAINARWSASPYRACNQSPRNVLKLIEIFDSLLNWRLYFPIKSSFRSPNYHVQVIKSYQTTSFEHISTLFQTYVFWWALLNPHHSTHMCPIKMKTNRNRHAHLNIHVIIWSKVTMNNVVFVLGCDPSNIIHLLSCIVHTNIWVQTPATSTWSQGKRGAGAPFQSYHHFKPHPIQSKYSKTKGRFRGVFKTRLRAHRISSNIILSSVVGTNMWGFEGGPPWHGGEGRWSTNNLNP